MYSEFDTRSELSASAGLEVIYVILYVCKCTPNIGENHMVWQLATFKKITPNYF